MGYELLNSVVNKQSGMNEGYLGLQKLIAVWMPHCTWKWRKTRSIRLVLTMTWFL